jgi:hypothetical protein
VVVFRFTVGSITHDYRMNIALCGNAIPELCKRLVMTSGGVHGLFKSRDGTAD